MSIHPDWKIEVTQTFWGTVSISLHPCLELGMKGIETLQQLVRSPDANTRKIAAVAANLLNLANTAAPPGLRFNLYLNPESVWVRVEEAASRREMLRQDISLVPFDVDLHDPHLGVGRATRGQLKQLAWECPRWHLLPEPRALGA